MSLLPCIAICNLTVTYQPNSAIAATKLITIPSLTIANKGLTAILGQSGSGKSTLLRAINRLNECWTGMTTTGQVVVQLEGRQWNVYPDSFASAACQIVDANSAALPVYPLEKLRQKMGMVFQSPHLLPLTIIRNITLPLTEGQNIAPLEAEHMAEQVLRQVGLWDEVKNRLHSSATRLSGGQMQRLCLARALALTPEVLLLDEPTASLDARSTEQVEEAIHVLSQQLTVLLVTHSQEQVNRLAHTQLRMQHGKLVG